MSAITGAGSAYQGTNSVAAGVPSRRKFNWENLLCWDAADNGLQALRFSLLLLHLHSRLPSPRSSWNAMINPTGYVVMRLLTEQQRKSLRRGLLLSTEGVANARRFALLGLWIYTFIKEVSLQWHKNKARTHAAGFKQRKEKRAEMTTVEKHTNPTVECSILEDNENTECVEKPAGREPLCITDFVASIGDFVAHVGESFDVAAFLHGSGLFWNAFGMKNIAELPPWLQRRRRGLERVGVFVSLAALVIQIYVAHRRRKGIMREMMHSVKAMRREIKRMDEDRDAAQELVPRARLSVEQTYNTLLAERRRLRWLSIEQWCLYGDMAFTLTEAWAPTNDNELLEASTGLFAAILRMLRLWNEIRFGSLDI